MPTIVTEIVNSMFRANRNRRDFAKKLRDMDRNSTNNSSASESDFESGNDASTLSQQLEPQPTEQYYLWGCELSRSHDVHVIKMDESIDENLENHLLLLKKAIVGYNGIEGERNVVEIQTTDFNDKEQRHPIASLTLGKVEMADLDLCLNWSKTREIKLKLVMGSGPITISGNHHIEYLGTPEEDDPDYVTEEDETEDEAELSTVEDIDAQELHELEEDQRTTNEGKRKRTSGSPDKTSPAKKRKSDSDNVDVQELPLKS